MMRLKVPGVFVHHINTATFILHLQQPCKYSSRCFSWVLTAFFASQVASTVAVLNI
jgi:hypothetical protein